MTTPVGSIRFDATIDGSRLPDQALAAVERVMAPMTSKLLTKLEQIERQVNELTRETARETAKQSAAYDRVAEAVEDVGDEHTKAAAKARTAGTISTRSLNAQTRALDRQTAAWAANTAARVANAGAPTGGPPTAGGRGGGGGGGGGFGSPPATHFSRGQSGSGGFFGFGGRATGAAGWNAVAGIIGSFPAAATVVTNLTGAIQQLVQVGGVLPGIFAGGATSIGTAVLGFKGMADAVSALNDAAASGDPKDLEKAAEALKDMDVSAVAVAKSVSKFTQGPLKDLIRNTQGSMFPGVAEEIDSLANKSMPTLMRGTAEVGSAWNKTFKELGRVGGLDTTQSFLDKIFGNTADAQTRANAAINPLVHGLGTLTSESSDFLPRLADGLTSVTTRFDTWITKSVNNGNLDKWIDQGITGVGRLGESFLNVGKMITSLTEAAGGDGGFLKWLEETTTKWADFMASTEGQEKLSAFFKEGREQLAQWGPILGNVASIVGDVYEASKQWADVLLPFLQTATGLLAGQPELIQSIFTGFLLWKTLGGFTSLLGGLGKIGGSLDVLPGKADKAMAGLNKAFALLVVPAIGEMINTELQSWLEQNHPALFNANNSNTPDQLGKRARDWVDENVLGIGPFEPGSLGGPQNASRDRRGVDRVVPDRPVPGTIDAVTPKPIMPTSVIDVINPQSAASIDAVNAKLQALRSNIETLPTGEVVLKDQTPEAIQRVKDLGLAVTQLPSGQLTIRVQYVDQNGRAIDPSQLGTSQRQIDAVRNPVASGGGWSGFASGGVLPGYSPRIDNLLGMLPGGRAVGLGGGEGILIPEAVRGIGGAPGVYAINSMFRKGLSRRGYADGGIVDAGMAGFNAITMPGGDTVLGLLIQIRDLLAGKQGGPLADTATSLTGGTGPRDPLKEMATAAIQALGGDPAKIPWLNDTTTGVGANSALGFMGPGMGGSGARGVLPAGAQGLLQFAQAADGGQYAFGASDLAKGLSDCSGAVSDLVELVTKGQAGPERLFSTANAAGVLQSLGAVPGLIPGTLQIGFKNGGPGGGHMAATLPNGVNFESGGRTGQGATYGGNAAGAGDPQFTDQWSLPAGMMGGLGTGIGDAVSGVASDMCGCVANAMPGADMLGQLAGGAINAVGDPLASVARQGLDAVLGVGDRPLPTNPADPGALLREGNPLALAGLLGYQVGDYSRQGGGLNAQNLLTNTGPGYTANGSMMSDTASLLDRTFSSLEASNDARHQQLMDVLSQVRDQLGEKLLGPVLEDGVRAGVSGLSDAASSAIGSSMGVAAAPPIADAVRSAVSGIAAAASGGGGGAIGAAGQAAAGVFDTGGILEHGNTALNLSGLPERVLSPTQTRIFDEAVSRGWALQPMQQHMATTSGVSTNDVVGAEFFGLSDVPIISTILNVIIGILLRLIGVELESRDTMAEMTGEVRQFRGQFQSFDAVGRIMSDTSALIERSQSSEEMAVDERVRILKLVISETIKWIIKQFVIPITEAVANTAIQAGAAAAGAAVNTQAPGAGGIVSSLISSAGTAAVGIGMDVWKGAVDAITPVATDLVGDLIEGLFPGLVKGLFSGKWLAGLFSRPIKGGIGGALGGLFGGLAGVADMSFDSGGVALGKGLMFKDVIKPERVLSPSQTQTFDRLPAALDRIANGSGRRGDQHIYLTQTFYEAPGSSRSAADDFVKAVRR